MKSKKSKKYIFWALIVMTGLGLAFLIWLALTSMSPPVVAVKQVISSKNLGH